MALLCCRKQFVCTGSVLIIPLGGKGHCKSIQGCSERSPLSCDETFLLGAVSIWTIPLFQRRWGATEWCDDYENVCNYSLRTWLPGGQRVFAVAAALRCFKIICPEGLLIYSFYLMLYQLWLFYTDGSNCRMKTTLIKTTGKEGAWYTSAHEYIFKKTWKSSWKPHCTIRCLVAGLHNLPLKPVRPWHWFPPLGGVLDRRRTWRCERSWAAHFARHCSMFSKSLRASMSGSFFLFVSLRLQIKREDEDALTRGRLTHSNTRLSSG